MDNTRCQMKIKVYVTNAYLVCALQSVYSDVLLCIAWEMSISHALSVLEFIAQKSPIARCKNIAIFPLHSLRVMDFTFG